MGYLTNMGCKFVLVNAPSAITLGKALREKGSVLNTWGVFLQLRSKVILPSETCRSLASLEMMILSTFAVLFLMSERIKSWNKTLSIMKNTLMLPRPQIYTERVHFIGMNN